ncbi:regulator of G-protein signaling 9-binding protein isoform X2 [Onychostruthus taczanowskii]|uniref:regulator of G-protein signaling 9-binding protein isoform X2 n=1 Tax=Onychostruthus taczanowskii TaxID=356909 RepID=UPI001B802CBD|nr:regulator of G-protein signaling 9-binding protein isoform X2 [Onychostruthus taczanowskii]
MVKEECKALLDALNKVTACYRHMVLTIGGTSDSQNLREELKKTRQKAQELAVANRNKLTTVLKDKTVSKEDKAEFERLWVIFSTCLEILEIDMRRALELGHEFPLNVPKKHLIQTGMSGGTSGVAARAMSVQNMKYEAEHNIDVVDLKDLENEINQKTILISLGSTLQMTFSWKKAVPPGWIPSPTLTARCCGTGCSWDVAVAAATAEPVQR